MIDIEKLRSFYYVIKEGSLVKAAKVLDKNHTTLSKHLTDLETSYNVKLFVRKRKRLELTDKGESLFTLAQNTIPNLENGAAEILNAPNFAPNPNRLRILTTNGALAIGVIRAVKKLQTSFPNLRPSIITTNADIDFKSSKADVAILPKMPGEGLSMKLIKTVYPGLFASREYLAKNGTPQSIEDLKNHKLLSYYSDFEGNVGNVDWHLRKGMPLHKLRESSLTINSGLLLFEAACQGLGIFTTMKDFELLRDSNLVNVLPTEESYSLKIFFITRADTILTEVHKHLLNVLQNSNE